MSVKSPAFDVREHDVVPHDEWIDARRALLAREKEFTRLRDELSQARRDLPWERVEKTYVLDGPDGKETLSEVFGPCSQLVVYHFMFGPDWDAGCKSCSFWADTFNGIPVHLRARDVTFAAISHAPRHQLEAYEKRMGWSFKWLSSYGTDFNRDFGVTFTEDEAEGGRAYYNYALQSFPDTEAPGVSVFYKADDGTVYHTYSSYGRGIDILNAASNYLDLAPKGRDEDDTTQSWVRRHDEYGA
jgi:predicted dithiol-disulfide oxidoreductase (DUF899 family)